jgi:hypothetical protein
VFSQHLLAGLRGAADRSGDGQVSLDEAYRYAFEHTQRGATGQHAGFANRLSGYGELQLTSLEKASGLIAPDRAQVLTLRESSSGAPLLSVREPDRHRLAVPPGRYAVFVERDGLVREGTVEVMPHEFLALAPDRLTASSRPAQLVRLSTTRRCLIVEVPRPDPLLRSVARRLETPSCPQPVVVTLTHDGDALAVSGKMNDSDSLNQSFPVSEVDALVARVQTWLADDGGNLATKQKD